MSLLFGIPFSAAMTDSRRTFATRKTKISRTSDDRGCGYPCLSQSLSSCRQKAPPSWTSLINSSCYKETRAVATTHTECLRRAILTCATAVSGRRLVAQTYRARGDTIYGEFHESSAKSRGREPEGDSGRVSCGRRPHRRGAAGKNSSE